MTVMHTYYELLENNDIGMSSLTMIGFCKQMSLALNFKDAGAAAGTLSEREAKMMVKEVPSLLTYMSYMFFCG